MSDISREITDEVYEAGENANNPSSTNAFATDAEILNLQTQINAANPGNAILSGGAAYSGTGLDYDVTALSYRIAGTIYASLATQVTLAAADVTFDKIEVLYVDIAGVVGVLAGVPAAAPVKPQVDPNTQVEITFVTIAAGATAPSGLTLIDVYLEDAGTPTEWATSAVGFAPDFASTTDPRTGTKCIDTLAAFGSNNSMIFTPVAPYAINGGDVTFWLNPQTSLSGPGTSFRVGFFVGGALVGTFITLGGGPTLAYGFNPLGPNGTYQLVTIPISAFGALPANVDDIRMYKPPGPPSITDMLIDDFKIIEGTAASGGGATDATAVTYTPTVPGDWGPVPDDVAEALDQLAAGGGGGLPNRVISWSFNGIYSNSSTSFASIPEQIQVPTAAELGGSTIQAILIVSYNTTGASTGEFRLFNYTDSVSEGFVTAVVNGTWVKGTSAQAAITGGKAYRVDLRRVGGTGGDSMQMESATLILIVS